MTYTKDGYTPDMIIVRSMWGWSLRTNDDQRLADALVASADDSQDLEDLADGYKASVIVVPDLPECNRCGELVTGVPVTDPGDPLERVWCSEECRDDDGQAWYEQHYAPR